jgi:hypothetical protein
MSGKAERTRLRKLRRLQERADRHVNRAHRLTRSGRPQPARVWLLEVGVSESTAQRFAPAFSRGVAATEVGTTEIKTHNHSQHTKTVPVKRYDRTTFLARLREYRPKDLVAAREFARAATAY